MPFSMSKMVYTCPRFRPSPAILGIEWSITVRAAAGTLGTFGNIIDVDEGSAFIQRIGQKCTHG